jgi:hypothetical protein
MNQRKYTTSRSYGNGMQYMPKSVNALVLCGSAGRGYENNRKRSQGDV